MALLAHMTYVWGNVVSVQDGEGRARYAQYAINDNNGTKITATATYSTDGNILVSTKDALDKTTTYGYNENTNVLEWVQYPEDTPATRTEYSYDAMYRLVTADANTDSGLSLMAEYHYTNDLLTGIETPSTSYSFTYGDFAQRSSVKVGTRTLASYAYTNDPNRRLDTMTYGNGDSVSYTYDDYGRVLSETFEDGATVTYQYDNTGALATVTDSETGVKTTYYYDFTDRLMKYVESGSDYSHSVGYEFDTLNNLTKLVETINGVKHTTTYAYDEDNRLTSVNNDGITESYTYDAYGRIAQKVTKNGSTTILTETYTYKTNNSGAPTGQVATLRTVAGDYDITYTYTYDGNGNILSVSDGTNTTTYVYDSANQLIRENNQAAGKTWVWAYDNAGNILSRMEFAYTTGVLGASLDTANYTYGDTSWRDLLTAYDGRNITYDAIGNPLSDGTWTYTWQHGRELASISDGETTWTYTYDANGMRTQRTNGSTTYSYIYNGDKLSQMTVGSNTLYFSYDASGIPMSLVYNGTEYYYAVSLQGDVLSIKRLHHCYMNSVFTQNEMEVIPMERR